ncbi:MAG: DUF3369 domain-containing protein, partial [Proteobacteria bacterium]|nr:DUF3369 domain-containing protein [Pseudomonadota bacterium]
MNMLVSTAPDELLAFLEDDGGMMAPSQAGTWRVLVVDDDSEVHQATVFALNDAVICSRPVELLHANSAEAALDILRTTPEVAVILLDVVMETHDAGLDLVRRIRQELGLADTRIILRTGQPGYAPEVSVVRDYDINDYRTKSELTHTRLLTTLTAAIRSYQQLRTLEETRSGLAFLVENSHELFTPRDLKSFAEATLGHLEVLLGRSLSALFLGPARGGGESYDESLEVLAARGKCHDVLGNRLESLVRSDAGGALVKARGQRAHVFEDEAVALYLGQARGLDALVYLEVSGVITPLVRQLLEVLSVSLRVGFENVVLFERLNFFAYFDPLTRLPNRTRFLDSLDEGLAGFADKAWILAIIDVVRFSELNDALGHRSGDLLLTEVTARLKARVSPEALLARVAGDAFGVCWRPQDEEPAAILDVFTAPFVVRGHAVPLRARAGFARMAPVPGGAVELLKRANLALSHAKMEGDQHWRFFTEEMESST